MTCSIDKLLERLEEICEYYAMHGMHADAKDIRIAISKYHNETNVDMCNSCKNYMCANDEYPCDTCAHAFEDDYYEYRDNWDEKGKYKY